VTLRTWIDKLIGRNAPASVSGSAPAVDDPVIHSPDEELAAAEARRNPGAEPEAQSDPTSPSADDPAEH
jgi:hypothetical protein